MQKIGIFIAFLLGVSSLFSQSLINEGFDNWPLDGWQIVLEGEATDGWRDDFENIKYSGTHSAYSSISNQQSDNWLVSPAVQILTNDYQVRFWELSSDVQYYDKCTVLISSGSSQPSSGDYQEVAECQLNTTGWQEQVIDLSEYEGETIYVAFRYEGTYHQWYVDALTVAPNNYTDASITEIVSPVGVSQSGGLEEVSVSIYNNGTSLIEDLTIAWSINNTEQDEIEFTSLNLDKGQNANVTLGTYDFSDQGSYTIAASLVLAEDFDDSNNSIVGTYEVAAFQDVELSFVSPEGMIPSAGDLSINAMVKNNGQEEIDAATIDWYVNGELQQPYNSTDVGLKSGESKYIFLGAYSFEKGIHEITATLSILGDVSENDNTYETKIAVDTFYESFEGRLFPPEGWSIDFGTRDGINFDVAVDGEFYYVSNVDDNFFGVVEDTMFTQALEISEGDFFRFYIKSNAFLSASISLISKDVITGEIEIIQPIANSAGLNNWELRNIDISSAAGIKQLGIVSISNGSYGETKFDIFTSDASLYQVEKDLKILNGDMYFLARQNSSISLPCRIKNTGSTALNGLNYQLKLYNKAGVELTSITGIDLQPWEEATLILDHTFEQIGEEELYFRLDFVQDENPADNEFRSSKVSVVPNTVIVNEVGSADFQNLNFPFTPNGNTNTLGEDDLSQLLYYNDEISQSGMMYGFAYYYDNLLLKEEVVKYPLKIWITQTSNEDMDDGWIPNENMTLVYDDTISILPGDSRDLYIPFDQPILINGLDNIVIKNHQFDPEWPPSIFRIYSTKATTEVTRSISVSDYYQLESENPPAQFFSTSDYCYTRFVIDPVAEQSILYGSVFDQGSNEVISNAKVSILGSSLKEETDEDGEYIFPQIVKGTYKIRVTADGYIDSEIEAVLIDDNQLLDLYLTKKEEISLTAKIVGNNNPTMGIADVLIEIKNEDSDAVSQVSNFDGEFVFDKIYGQSSYEMRIFIYGYLEKILTIDTEISDVDLGDIVLLRDFISPLDAEVNSESSPTISWKSPRESAKIKLQQDLNFISFSYTNEPNEEVWLGNYFPINEITTLTSVEIRTDIYENAIDFVTIEIYDYQTSTFLASSQPFLIYPDSLHQIDIPNIVVYDDIAVMVKWQNNEASTNALALDFSQEDISNSAVILQPGNDINLLTDFFGAGAPNMSFLVRVNTLDPANPITVPEIPMYNIYRGLAAEFPIISGWKLLNENPITELSYVDQDTLGIDGNEQYRYAIETVYTNGFSEVTYSNSISGNIISSADYINVLTDIEIFPNPTSDVLIVSMGEKAMQDSHISILNVEGKQVKVQFYDIEESGQIKINIVDLPAGTYFIKIKTESGSGIAEFIKM